MVVSQLDRALIPTAGGVATNNKTPRPESRVVPNPKGLNQSVPSGALPTWPILLVTM